MECSISSGGRLQLSFDGAGSCEEVRRSGVILLTMVCGITLSRKITAQQHSFILMESQLVVELRLCHRLRTNRGFRYWSKT